MGGTMKSLEIPESVKLFEKEGYAVFSINPKIYPLDLIYSASYVLMDKAYIFLDGDPQAEILVELRKKDGIKISLKQIVFDFNDELLNYAVYKQQSEKNKGIREAILRKILLENDPTSIKNQNEIIEDEQKFDDPEEILKLWEESEKKIENEALESSLKKSKKC
jgi:His-Xaa-Ser system protein HxsD